MPDNPILDLTITVDSANATRYLDDVARKQIPFAESKALSAVALAFQAAEFHGIEQRFTVRRESWVKRSIKITHFAKKKEPWATIAIQPPGTGGASRADILGKFERDTAKRSRRAGGLIAIPIGAKRTAHGIVRGRDRPHALDLHPVGQSIRGARHTFLVQTADGRALILQRTAQGVRALYLLMPEVRIHPTLEFEATAQRVVAREWDEAFRVAFAHAMETAK
jgi:hypothetical protein